MEQTTQKDESYLTKQEAHRWFTSQRENDSSHPYARKGKERLQILEDQYSPMWKKLKRRMLSGDKRVLEISIHPKKRLSVTLGGYESIPQKEIQPTPGFARLVMIKDNVGHIHAAIMYIIGTENYLEKHNHALKGNTFLKTEDRFSGAVLFRSFPSGEFMWGYRYENGVRQGTVALGNKPTETANHSRMSADCSVPIVKTVGFCVTYNGHESCAVIGTEIVGYVNFECGNRGGGGVSGGGSIPPAPVHHGGGSGGGIPSGYPEGGSDDELPTLLNPLIDSIYYDGLANYPCAEEAVRATENLNNNISKLIMSIFGESVKYNIHYGIDNSLEGTNKDGQTIMKTHYQDTTYSSITRLDININFRPSFANNATQLAIVIAALHEEIHAYYYYREAIAITDTEKEELKKEFNFLQPYDPHDPVSVEGAEHNQMATDYINQLVSALKEYYTISDTRYQQIMEYYPNSHLTKEDLYKALAWGGLTGTNAWQKFEQQNTELAKNYLNIQDAEDFGTNLCIANDQKCN